MIKLITPSNHPLSCPCNLGNKSIQLPAPAFLIGQFWRQHTLIGVYVGSELQRVWDAIENQLRMYSSCFRNVIMKEESRSNNLVKLAST
jgi:hypothetical protein